jgi:cysteine desulfurase
LSERVSPRAPGRSPADSVLYLDHHATTPLDERVLEAMLPWLSGGPRGDFGNPSSATHVYGWRAEAGVEDARERLAAAIGAEPREIVFTSGATESDNLALFGVSVRRPTAQIVSVVTEHPAVLDPLSALEREGVPVHRLGVDARGHIDLDALESALERETCLVSIMWANGEIGVLSPMDEIAGLCADRGVALHSDAAQAMGKVPVDVTATPVSLLSISAHKMYGPKGVGALYVRRKPPRARLSPRQLGGGQEGGLRSGTLPVHQVVGLAVAAQIAVAEREAEAARLARQRDALWARIEASLGGVQRNGDPTRCLPGNLSVSFEGVEGDKLLLALPDLALSTGSACSSGSTAPSPVLKALGHDDGLARATLRFGLGRFTRDEEVETAAARVIEEVRKARGGV